MDEDQALQTLKNLGLNLETLSEESKQKLEKVGKLVKGNMKPEHILTLMKQQGINIASLLKEMKPGGVEAVPKVSKRIGRNNMCPCGSKKKYKKCCLVDVVPKG